MFEFEKKYDKYSIIAEKKSFINDVKLTENKL